MDGLHIKQLTWTQTQRRVLPPPAKITWQQRYPAKTIPWNKVWRITSFYCTPRDQITWLKLHHRNLYVANRDPSILDQGCKTGCGQPESMRHLATCGRTRSRFWDKVLELMNKMGMYTPTIDRDLFLILGRIDDTRVVDQPQAGMLFLAWRCLYAAVTQARLEDRRLLLLVAYERFVRMLHGRINAHGRRWQVWVRRNQNTAQRSIIPIQHRQRTVIEQWADGHYQIHKKLREELAEVSPSRLRAP